MRSDDAVTAGPGGLDAVGAATAVRRGDLQPDDLLADAWRRARRWEPWLGALVRPIDRLSAHVDGPLAGVVVGVKDALSVAGSPREVGAPEAVDTAPADTDATAVAGLADAGVTLMAATQVHPLCFGVVTPATRNPRAPERIAGGSSGGSAAALAAGLVHAALGTDTGGSVRGPAACCGVVGLKTTRGLVGLTGAFPLTWSLDTVGPMATSVRDTAATLDALVRPDPADPVHVADPPRPVAPAGRLRIGVPRELDELPVDADVRAVWWSAIEALIDDGHTVVDIDLPGMLEAPRSNGLIIAAEAAALHPHLVDTDPPVVPDTVHARLRAGARSRATEVAVARRQAVVFGAAVRRVLATTVDVVCTPTLACRVPDVGQDEVDVDGTTQRTTYAMTTLTNPWNLIGVPAGSVPAGHDRDGGPVGVQLIGPWWGEATVLRAMEAVEHVTGGPWPAVPAPDHPNPEERR